jgi:hypothetical protein
LSSNFFPSACIDEVYQPHYHTMFHRLVMNCNSIPSFCAEKGVWQCCYDFTSDRQFMAYKPTPIFREVPLMSQCSRSYLCHVLPLRTWIPARTKICNIEAGNSHSHHLGFYKVLTNTSSTLKYIRCLC